MKVLFVSAILPYPLYSGGQVRVYNLLSRLGEQHDITLATFLRSLDEKRWEKNLSFCKKIITCYRGHAWQPGYVMRSLVGGRPLLLVSYAHDDLRREIGAQLATGAYDLVHIEPWYVWPSLPNHALPMVVATHNIEYAVYTQYVKRFPIVPFRFIYWWDVGKLRLWEERVWKRASHVVAVSEQDAGAIQRCVGFSPPVSVVPNGVDVPSFRFAPKKKNGAPTFLFVGSFAWIQNQDAAAYLVTSIWPVLRDRYPGATLRIVGGSMPDSIRRRVTGPGVTILGEVENIEHELYAADILLAPIRIGGGTRFKILEAMASGLAVVTTTRGAMGLRVTHGRELMVGDTRDQFVAAVETLLSSPRKRQEMARRARTVIEREYSWDRIAAKLGALWYETAKRHA